MQSLFLFLSPFPPPSPSLPFLSSLSDSHATTNTNKSTCLCVFLFYPTSLCLSLLHLLLICLSNPLRINLSSPLQNHVLYCVNHCNIFLLPRHRHQSQALTHAGAAVYSRPGKYISLSVVYILQERCGTLLHSRLHTYSRTHTLHRHTCMHLLSHLTVAFLFLRKEAHAGSARPDARTPDALARNLYIPLILGPMADRPMSLGATSRCHIERAATVGKPYLLYLHKSI